MLSHQVDSLGWLLLSPSRNLRLLPPVARNHLSMKDYRMNAGNKASLPRARAGRRESSTHNPDKPASPCSLRKDYSMRVIRHSLAFESPRPDRPFYEGQETATLAPHPRDQ